MSLLLAILLTPLQAARRQAMATRCAAQLQQIGLALEHAHIEYVGYYPYWDDGGSPTRYTWIDVLVQRRLLADGAVAYCPEDSRPDALNWDRGHFFNVYYPGHKGQFGIDYSYGIGAPLSAAGWNWSWTFAPPSDDRRRVFENHERDTSKRLLAADAVWSTIYNLSGDVLEGHAWNYPTVYDNTIGWRHGAHRAASILYQDGHLGRVVYHAGSPEPVNTSLTCVWYPGESLHAGHETVRDDGNYYPDAPPINFQGDFSASIFPREMIPVYYTRNLLWTQINNK